MAKDLRITFLLDFYGDMLTEKQREVVECYYNEDLSLAEIAEEKGITRQGVRDGIKRAEQQLLEMEERLGLAKALPQRAGRTDADLRPRVTDRSGKRKERRRPGHSAECGEHFALRKEADGLSGAALKGFYMAFEGLADKLGNAFKS